MTRFGLAITLVALCACGPRHRHEVLRQQPPTPVVSDPARQSTVADAPPVTVSPLPPPTGEAAVAPTTAMRRPVDAVLAEVNSQLQDVFFAYEKSEPAPEALSALEHDAKLILQVFADFPGVTVTIEGHCDERGSAEYNLALGDRRATRASIALHQFGVPDSSMSVVSFGKEMPQCAESNETCWSRNRRAHLVLRLPRLPSD